MKTNLLLFLGQELLKNGLNFIQNPKINLYDWDKTIYDGDSSKDFFFYMLKHKYVKFTNILKIFGAFILWKIRIFKKEDFKQVFFSFVKNVPDIDSCVLNFWEEHRDNIKNFYLEKKHNKDVIISASPEFLLIPICKELKVKKLIASRIDKHTGMYTGINCWGEEKVRRLNKIYRNYEVMESYSDSLSDRPILELAHKAYIVKGDRLIPYQKQSQ